MIKKVNPNVVEFDFDADHSELLRWDELDKVKQLEETTFSQLGPKELEYLKAKTDKILGLK
jgi:cytochrome b involved in lipid metabolism